MEVSMSRSFRSSVVLGIVAVLALGSATLADAGGRKVLDASMVGLPASMAGQSFLGAQAGGLPWALERGEAKLFSNGRLQVQVTGLVLAAGAKAGTNPIPTGRALVSCGGAVVAMSSVVPYSATGDAMVNERVDLPASCVAPTVFFAGIVGGEPLWFAATGW
jgi:peptidoglycan/LPS O-acetylase OafA/YrhL